MAGENFEEICNNIKACLNSSKRQTSLSELNRDYKSVLGDSIPFRSLGYSSLEKLICAVPDLKLCHVGKELFVDVKPDEKTMHITNLVRGQKAGKKKSKGSRYGNSVYRAPRRMISAPSKSWNKEPNSYNNRRSKSDTYQEADSQNDENFIFKKYRSSRPSDLDFSDVEDHTDEFAAFSDEDSIEVISPVRKETERELNSQMNKLHVTLGASRKVSMNRTSSHPFNKQQHSSKNNLIDDDVGYVSMNDMSSLIGDQLSGSRCQLDMGEYKPISVTQKLSSKRTPASIIAAGRKALTEPNTSTLTSPQNSGKSPLNVIDRLIYGEPFQSPNKPIDDLKKMKNLELLLSEVPVKHSPTSSKSSLQHSPISPKSGLPKPLPSKMSDPNMFKPGPNIPPNFLKSTWCSKLQTFVLKHNLPIPEFTNFTKYDPKTKLTSYMCKIKIGDSLSFTSCPFESHNIQEVQEHVGKIAFDELSRRDESNHIAVSVTKDKETMLSRIAEIVGPYTNGLKSEMIEKEYKKLHGEILPFNWLDIVKDLSLLSVESLVGGIYVYPSNESMHVISNVTKVPTLILPENNIWDVYVTCCSSTNNIYFRIVHENYNGRFETMVEKMNEIYSDQTKLQPVDMVKEGNYYVAFLENEWFRVKALTDAIGNKVKVSLIDHGDIDEIPKDSIYPLNVQLTDVPAQAVRCGLSDLEQYSNQPYISKTLSDLIFGKSVVARVDLRNPHLLLTIFDTSTEDDIDLNAEIKNKIVKELSPPSLPSKNVVTEVHLTSIQEDGLAYIQLITESFKFLRSLLANANQELTKNETKYIIKSPSELIGGQIFLVKYTEDNLWYRAYVNNLVEDKNQVEVVFVDYGNIEVVPLENIVDIKYFTDVLGIIPPQAIQVQLVKPTNELFTQSIIEFLMRMALYQENESMPRIFIMKVVEKKAIPDIELYVRLPDNNKLVSVNDIIGSYYPNYRGSSFSGIKLSSVMSLFESLPQIEAFPVPLGKQFNVHVAMVSNPSHFIVQPLDHLKRLQDMMLDMNTLYEKEQPIVAVDDLKVGRFYAVKRESDNLWCRGILLSILIDSNSISMKLIDYGDVISVKYQNLVHLLPCFRELPCLAIKARLAGIVPVYGDWNFTDCVRFAELVSDKNMPSIAVEDDGDNKVSLMLIDQSYDEEINIGALLVEEGCAKEIV